MTVRISSLDRLIALGLVCTIIIVPGTNMSQHGRGVVVEGQLCAHSIIVFLRSMLY